MPFTPISTYGPAGGKLGCLKLLVSARLRVAGPGEDQVLLGVSIDIFAYGGAAQRQALGAFCGAKTAAPTKETRIGVLERPLADAEIQGLRALAAGG